MENDFIIRRHGDRWRAVAVSDRGKAFAEADPRFEGGEAELDRVAVPALHQELLSKLLYTGLPDGLPPPPPSSLAVRIALLLILIILPLLLFAMLV